MSVSGKERIAHYLPDLFITLFIAMDYDYIHVTGDLWKSNTFYQFRHATHTDAYTQHTMVKSGSLGIYTGIL